MSNVVKQQRDRSLAALEQSASRRRQVTGLRGEAGKARRGVWVVGYDGTALGRAAVIRAAMSAGGFGRVFIVHPYRLPPPWLGAPYRGQRLGAFRSHADRAVRELFGAAGGLPTNEYEIELIGGDPLDALALVASTRDAEAIVVPTPWAGRLRWRLASFEKALARRTPIPVITMRRGLESDLLLSEAACHPARADRVQLPDPSLWW